MRRERWSHPRLLDWQASSSLKEALRAAQAHKAESKSGIRDAAHLRRRPEAHDGAAAHKAVGEGTVGARVGAVGEIVALEPEIAGRKREAACSSKWEERRLGIAGERDDALANPLAWMDGRKGDNDVAATEGAELWREVFHEQELALRAKCGEHGRANGLRSERERAAT